MVCNAARSFASRLARSLAFAAAAVLFAFVEIARFQSCNSFHDNDSLQLIYSIIETKMFFVKSYPTLIRRRNTSRNGGEHMSAELVAHKPHCSNRNLLQLFALVLCAPLPTRRKLCFHRYNSRFCSLVFVVCEPGVRSTSEGTGWNYFRPRTSDTAFSRFVLPRACLPFVARNELAIATKSIASVLPHAKRTPWVPSKYAEGERR